MCPQGDFPARKMIDAVPAVSEERKQRLMSVLDVDPAWRMHQVSDGQRRRVQICVGLLRPFKVRMRLASVWQILTALRVAGSAGLARVGARLGGRVGSRMPDTKCVLAMPCMVACFGIPAHWHHATLFT